MQTFNPEELRQQLELEEQVATLGLIRYRDRQQRCTDRKLQG